MRRSTVQAHWCMHACRDSIKGVRALVASGSVEASPEAIASFLRQHNSSLDKEQLGEYLGHHDELEVSFHCCRPCLVQLPSCPLPLVPYLPLCSHMDTSLTPHALNTLFSTSPSVVIWILAFHLMRSAPCFLPAPVLSSELQSPTLAAVLLVS